MKLYIVFGREITHSSFVKIFRTEDQALKFIEAKEYPMDYYIEEYELDEVKESK